MVFYQNLAEKCVEIGKSPSAVAEELGFHRSEVSRWRRGAEPRDTTLIKFAKYFGCPVDDFKRDPEEVRKNRATGVDAELEIYLEELRRRPETRALLAASRGMSKEQVERMTHFISSIREDS